MRKSVQPLIEGGQERRPWLAKQRARAAGPSSARASAASEDSASVRAGAARTDKHGRRFVEPYPYTETQRAAIIAALAGAGLGDETAREVFVGAIAYDLAVLAEALRATAEAAPEDDTAGDRTDDRAQDAEHHSQPPEASAAAPPDTEKREGELALAAAHLAELLDALGTDGREHLVRALDASDTFGRSHGEAYLAALTREVRQVAEAAASLPQSRQARAAREPTPASADRREPTRSASDAVSKRKPAPKSAPAASETAGRAQAPEAVLAFIRHAAAVYEQCFDMRPTSKVSDPFARALAAVARSTEIALPIRARLLKAALDPAR